MVLTTKLRSFSFKEIRNLEADSENFKKVAEDVMREYKSVGFLRLVDIPDFDDKEFLAQIKYFYNLSIEEKMQMALARFQKQNKNSYRGYMPLIENISVYKEQTDFGNEKFNRENTDDECRKFMEERNSYPNNMEFKRVIEKYYEIYAFCGNLILKLCAVALNLGEDYFTKMFLDNGENKHLSTFRILHYPPRVQKKNLGDKDIPISTPAHVDSSILTLLCTFDNYGLQVKDKEDRWVWVEPIQDSLIVNLGTVMENMSNRELPATIHRVMDLGENRYSAPMFVEPCYSNLSYEHNYQTQEKWTAQTPSLTYGEFNILTGGRHGQSFTLN